MSTIRQRPYIQALGLIFMLLIGSGARADELPTLSITVFSSPSQSIWIPTLIKELGLDKQQGFILDIKQKPSQVAYADFASGNDPVCYCVAIPAAARFKQQGADSVLLWNVFNYDAFIVTNNPDIVRVKDIENHTLQADTVTGNWALSSWFLQAQGVDLAKVHTQSASSVMASLAELGLHRIDGVLLNPTQASEAIMRSKEPLRAIGLFSESLWREKSGTDVLPTITFGVTRAWYAAAEHQDLARRFYAANLAAERYIKASPADAAQRVSGPAKMDARALVDVFTRFGHLINIQPLTAYRPTLRFLTQQVLPAAGQLPRPLTDAQVDELVADFKP